VNDESTFVVVRPTHTGEIGVRLTLRDDRIEVAGHGVSVRFIATLTLNNAGECRLLVDSEDGSVAGSKTSP
jgi:hypothetical protein